jgi:branched-chain amino acid transport system ATP-binding protein
MLRLINVEVIYNEVILVLRGISIEVPGKAIVTLLGANGAGKSTTLKAISGLLKPELGKISAGTVWFDEKRIDGLDPEAVASMGIIQVMEGRRVLEHLTVEENLKLGAYILGRRVNVSKELDRAYSYFPPLRKLRKATSGYLSGGEQQMLVMGRALMVHPKVMLLDEPSLGLAPLVAETIFEVMKEINNEEQTAILLVEQNAHMALNLASYGYVMENGRIVLDGSAEKLHSNEDVQEFYLGFSKAAGETINYRDVKHYKRRKRWL